MRNRKFYILLAALSFFLGNSLFAQRLRLGSGTPYDVFIGVRGGVVVPQGNMAAIQLPGGGGKVFAEFQLQEKKIGIGLEVGADYHGSKHLYYPALNTWENGQPVRFMYPTKASVKIPLSLYANYYLLNESVKPYLGVGIGLLHGGYDQAYLLPDSVMGMPDKQKLQVDYYSGWQLGGLVKVGFSYALNHRHLFGIEGAYNYYLKRTKLITYTHYGISLYYAYIFD